MTDQNINQNPENDKGMDLLSKARSERELLQKENDRLEANIKELRELEASRILGSTAGGRPPVQQLSEEEIKKKQASEFWAGTMIGAAIEKTK